MIPIQRRLKIASSPLEEAMYQLGCEIRCAIPAIVKSFDPGPLWGFPSVSVQPAIRETILQDAAVTLQDLPILDAVPVSVPQGGDWIDTFPIAEGDECLLVFSDTAIDLWKQNGGVQKQPDGVPFRHDIGDAIAVFGVRSSARPVANWSTTSRQIRNVDGSVVIDLAAGAITVTAASTTITATGGNPLPLVNSVFLEWYVANIQPFLVSKGYAGPAPPAGMLTTALEAD
jgi:hypothetical protein